MTLRRVLMETVIIKENSKSRRVTKFEAILLRTVNAAASGNVQALNIIAQYQAAQRRPINENPPPPSTIEILTEGEEEREQRIRAGRARRGQKS